MRYYAIQCSKCGKWGAKQVKEDKALQDTRFKCTYCRKSQALHRKKEFGLTIKVWPKVFNSVQISKVVAYLNNPNHNKEV